MKPSSLIIVSILIHLAALLSYPETGRLGITFLYISLVLWISFSFLIGRHTLGSDTGWKAAQLLFFALACAFSTLSFLPQKDGVNALQKLSEGKYPDRQTVFTGLMRLGVYCPSLLSTPQEEIQP